MSAMGGFDVLTTMPNLRALFDCFCLDDRCSLKRNVAACLPKTIEVPAALIYLCATDVRRIANIAELAVITTLARGTWLRRSSTVVIE